MVEKSILLDARVVLIKYLIELLLEEREVSPSVTSSVSAAATKNPKDPRYFG